MIPDELTVWWPGADAASISLLGQLAVTTVITTPDADAGAIRHASMNPVAEVEPSPDALAKARAAGFRSAAVRAPAELAALRPLLQDGFVSHVYLKPEQISWDVAPALALAKTGVWPGIHPLDTQVASASAGVWVDSNLGLVGWLRARYPERATILGYRADEDAGVSANRAVPYESVEIALLDAMAAGGRFVLSIPDDYRKALLRKDARALAAWKSLAKVTRFARAHSTAMTAPPASKTGVIAGTEEQSGEVLNLAFRQNISPRVLDVDNLPELSGLDVVAAANVQLTEDGRRKLLEFAKAGGVALTAPSEWVASAGLQKIREDKDRDVYSAGRGRVYAYRAAVEDPGEFALDMREAAGEQSGPVRGPKNLDLRIWETGTVLGVLRNGGSLVLVNYGSAVGYDFLIGVRGRYRHAVIATPESPVFRPLLLMPRPGRVECNLKDFRRTAIVMFKE